MNISLEPGTYVLAVSGGIDSMVLLDILSKKQGLRLVVAHFDHGIRFDSDVDRRLVQKAADKYGLPFVFDRVELGPGASEDVARKARYKFLRRVKDVTGAKAIITAHHQDDLIETAIINLIRGTGRKGVSSLKDTKDLLRPLLNIPKADLLDYAQKHGIKWREDSTNEDTNYFRNYVRKNILSKLKPDKRKQLSDLLAAMKYRNRDIDKGLSLLLQKITSDKVRMNRQVFVSLPSGVAHEVMAAWLRSHDIRQFDKKLIRQLVIGSKTLTTGKRMDVDASHHIVVSKQYLTLVGQRTRNKEGHSV